MKTKEKKKSKWKMIAGIMLVIQLLLSLATVGVVLWLNIVPTLYVILLGLILLLLLIIEYCLFYFGKKKKGKKRGGEAGVEGRGNKGTKPGGTNRTAI